MVLKILLLLVSSICVFFIEFNTLNISSAQLAKKITDEVFFVLCGKGKSFLAKDPLFVSVSPVALTNLIPTLVIGILCIFAAISLRKHKGISIALRSVGFTIAAVFIIVSSRYNDDDPQGQASCISFASVFNRLVQQTSREVVGFAFNLISYLPPLLFGLPQTHPVQQTYVVGIHPHIAEYLVTIQPHLHYFYGFLGFVLLVRPFYKFLWNNYFAFSTMLGLVVTGLSLSNPGNPWDAPEPMIILVLKVVIFQLLSMALVGCILQGSRVIAQRLTMLSLLFVVMRAHSAGVPFLGLHIEIPLVVTLANIIHSTCDSSKGAILLWAVIGYWYELPTIEWALFVKLLDNVVLSLFERERKRNTLQKMKTE